MQNSSLQLDHVRGVLIRLEDTIIFGCIERAQFRQNLLIYKPGGVARELGQRSLLDYMLYETECAHAKVRRYNSPDEYPFFENLPPPILPPLDYAACPLRSNHININRRIREVYEQKLIPAICLPGDDQQYGSSAVGDVALLQALSRRIHYGQFVAESKYQRTPDHYDRLIDAADASGLEAAITVPEVEARLFERVQRKTATYVHELASSGETTISAQAVRAIYEDWIIPLCKTVEVEYLLARNQAEINLILPGGPTCRQPEGALI